MIVSLGKAAVDAEKAQLGLNPGEGGIPVYFFIQYQLTLAFSITVEEI